MNEQLEEVKKFVAKAHQSQTRKYSSEPYTEHLVRVMQLCKQHTTDTCVLSAALLHDVLEDTNVTTHSLQTFLKSVFTTEEAEAITKLVLELTDIYTKQKHPRWNRKKRKLKEAKRIANTSPQSQTIKYADIIDNCTGMANKDPEFAALFVCECQSLLKVIPNGNKNLYAQAQETVAQQLQQLKKMQH